MELDYWLLSDVLEWYSGHGSRRFCDSVYFFVPTSRGTRDQTTLTTLGVSFLVTLPDAPPTPRSTLQPVSVIILPDKLDSSLVILIQSIPESFRYTRCRINDHNSIFKHHYYPVLLVWSQPIYHLLALRNTSDLCIAWKFSLNVVGLANVIK
jgi:hypothetical protein